MDPSNDAQRAAKKWGDLCRELSFMRERERLQQEGNVSPTGFLERWAARKPDALAPLQVSQFPGFSRVC